MPKLILIGGILDLGFMKAPLLAASRLRTKRCRSKPLPAAASRATAE